MKADMDDVQHRETNDNSISNGYWKRFILVYKAEKRQQTIFWMRVIHSGE